MDDLNIPDQTEAPIPEPIHVPEPSPLLPVPEGAGAWRELGEVLWLSLPIIVTMLSYTVMNFVDVLMVGRHSAEALAAVGPATSCFFLIASLLMGTLSITNTFVAQNVGRGRKQEAPGYVWQSLYLGLLWGAVALLLVPAAPGIFRFGGHAPQVQAFEVIYFQVMLFRIPAVGFWHGLAAFYQATRRPQIPMVAALVGNVFNILANYALIFGHWGFPEMGIEGAALATVLASYLPSALLLGVFLGRAAHREYGTRRAWRPHAAKMWQLMRFGLPAGVTWALENASWTLFLLRIIGSLGNAALAANGAAMQIIHVSFMPVIGLNIGIQAVVGHHIGMGDHAGAKRRTYRVIGVAVGYMATMGLLFFIFRRPLIGWFVSGDTDAETAGRIIAMGSTMLIFGAIFQAFDAVAITCYGALRGAGDTRFPMLTTIGLAWFVFIPLALWLVKGLHLGVAGAWLAVTIFVALIGVVNFWRLAGDAWRKIDIFKGEQPVAAEPSDATR